MVLRLLTISLAVLFFSHIQAQTAIDSVINELKQKLDTATGANRIQTLLEISQRYQSSDPQKSIEWAEKILKLDEADDDLKAQAVAYGSISSAYYYAGEMEKAIEYSNKSYECHVQMGDWQRALAPKMNIGVFYESMGQPEKAMSIYKEILNQKDLYNISKYSYSNLNNNIANVLRKQGIEKQDSALIKEAIDYYRKTVAIDMQDKSNKLGLSKTYNNLANSFDDLYLITGEKRFYLDSAAYYFKKSVDIKKSNNDISGLAFAYGNISMLYVHKKNGDSAVYYAQKALDFAKKLDNKGTVSETYERLAEAYSVQKNYKQAYENEVKALFARDSFMNSSMGQKIAELDAKYDLERKAKENQTLAAENAKKKLEVLQEKRKSNILLFSSVLLFIVILATFLILRQRENTKNQKLIHQQQKLRFKAVVEAEQNERHRITRELHDGVGQMLAVIKMTVSRLRPNNEQDENEERLGTALKLIENTIDEVRSISHNMMPIVLMEKGFNEAVAELVNQIKETDLLDIQLENKIEGSLQSSTSVALYRIIQEVLNNMIKHSKANTIYIFIEQRGDKINLLINDDGIGFDTKRLDTTDGIGWRNIANRVLTLDGKIDVNSEKGKGTSVNIDLVA